MPLVHQVPGMAAQIMGVPDLSRDDHANTNNVFAGVANMASGRLGGSVNDIARSAADTKAKKANAPKELAAQAADNARTKREVRMLAAAEGKSGQPGGSGSLSESGLPE